jgi:hypothetical protein
MINLRAQNNNHLDDQFASIVHFKLTWGSIMDPNLDLEGTTWKVKKNPDDQFESSII